MALFNFFLVLASLVSAGLASAILGSQRLAVLGVLLGLLLSLVSFVWWKLDQRVSFLIRNAERAIADLEAVLLTTVAQLFLHEPSLTSELAYKGNGWQNLWTYGKAFRLTFWAIGLFGAGGSIISFTRAVGYIDW